MREARNGTSTGVYGPGMIAMGRGCAGRDHEQLKATRLGCSLAHPRPAGPIRVDEAGKGTWI